MEGLRIKCLGFANQVIRNGTKKLKGKGWLQLKLTCLCDVCILSHEILLSCQLFGEPEKDSKDKATT